MAAESDGSVGGPESSDGTGNALLDAAEACFEEWGVAKTSMEDVARRAGLSRPTLYRYFGDREALSVAVVLRRSRRVVVGAREYIARRHGLADRLVAGIAFLVDQGRRDQIVLDLVASGRLTGASEQVTHGGAVHRITRTVWEPVLDQARRDGELRADLDVERALSWLVHLQIVLVATGGPADGAQECAAVRQMIRDFVVPAFLADGARG